MKFKKLWEKVKLSWEQPSKKEKAKQRGLLSLTALLLKCAFG